MAEEYSQGSGTGSGVTTALMVVAVLAVVASFAGFIFSLVAVSPTGYASSDEGNVTFEIATNVDISFVNNLINWSSGYVNTTSPCDSGFATLSTTQSDGSQPGRLICTVDWQQQNQGLTLRNDGNVDMNITLTSDQNATTLIDGVGNNYGSYFRWRVSQNETSVDGPSCNPDGDGLAPTTYADIEQGVPVKICDSFNSGDLNDQLDIDFELNISAQATLTGYQTAEITASAERANETYQNATVL